MKEELIKTVVGELFETTKSSEVARDVMRSLLMPAASELGEWFADKVRVLRYSSSLKKGLEKVRKMHQDVGTPMSRVPLKKLLPILEGIALEEVGEGKDETLHDMWSALLANAASPDGGKVRPGFVAILKQMSSDEASLLHWVHKAARKGEVSLDDLAERYGSYDDEHSTFPSFPDWFPVALDQLQAYRLLSSLPFVMLETSKVVETIKLSSHAKKNGMMDLYSQIPGEVSEYEFRLTALGKSFIEACQPPKGSTTAEPGKAAQDGSDGQ